MLRRLSLVATICIAILFALFLPSRGTAPPHVDGRLAGALHVQSVAQTAASLVADLVLPQIAAAQAVDTSQPQSASSTASIAPAKSADHSHAFAVAAGVVVAVAAIGIGCWRLSQRSDYSRSSPTRNTA